MRGRTLVLGLGLSGVAAAEALLRAGADVRAADGNPALAVDLETDVRLGPLDVSLLDGCDLVIASPGIPPPNPVLAAAAQRGIPVWSEPELAWRLGGGRTQLVGVTGTNGKTTTTELIAACLDAPAGGNIGTPLVGLLASDEPPPVVVAELSSFQLHHTAELRTDVGVLLNLAPDHLDWHGTLAAYAADKARIWANHRGTDTAVVVSDDRGAVDVVAAHPPAGRLVTVTSGEPAPGQVGVVDGCVVARVQGTPVEVVAVDQLGARGHHNLTNCIAAVAAAVAAGADAGALAEPLRAFRPGPHRLEVVASDGGVTWVNDSKATNPHAAAAALTSYDSVIWIAGGLTKGVSFDALAGTVAERVRAAVTIGGGGPEIAAFVRAQGVEAVEAGELTVAVHLAAALARPGDTVLLAPACASMDQFADYAERGDVFRAAVAEVTGGD